jgi:alpha-mannosidase
VDVSARLLWNERSARLKLVFPCGDRATFDVPGAIIDREPNLGEVPGGRFVRISGPLGDVGFASDALYNFDCTAGVFRATVCRASRYADDVKTYARHEAWRAAVDAGELKFNFLLTCGDVQELSKLARHLEQPPVALIVPPHDGKLGRSGSLGELKPDTLRLLALKPAADGKGLILRVQETAGRATQPKLTLLGKTVRLTKVPAHRIATWRLTRGSRASHGSRGKAWKAKLTDATELA